MKKDNNTGESRRGKNPKTAFLLILSISAVVLVSGCIANFTRTQQAGILNPTATSETQDIVLKAEAVPLEVRSGKKLDLYFELDALKDLRNLSFNIIDNCLFSGDTGGFENQELKANRSKDFKLTLTSGIVNFDTDCQIRFRASYNTTLLAAQDIIVLDDSEFIRQQRSGAISQNIPRFVSTPSPLQISLSFSEQQPFENNVDEFMYIEYLNTGPGILDKLDADSVQFTMPGNVKITCDDYTAQGNSLVLNRDLTFMNGHAKKSTCKISTQASQPVDFRTMQITVNYNYSIVNSVNVKVKPK